MIGINGIVTFKNSGLREVVKSIPLENLLLETDAPFLAPVPFRGKRNESSYLVEIAAVVAEIYSLSNEGIGEITSRNADTLFQFNSPDAG
jgi:TatD DNase family protein